MLQRRLLWVLMIAVAIGCGWIWFPREPDVVPMTALVPARPSAAAPTPPPTAPATGHIADADSGSAARAEQPVRQAADPTARPPRLEDVVVEVLVLGAESTPQAAVAVFLHAPGDRGLVVVDTTASTGTDGIARFHVPVPVQPGADEAAEPAATAAGEPRPGRTVTVGCALGGRTLSAPLPPPRAPVTTVRLTLQIAPRCIVEGVVVDASGQGVADAEVVFLPWQARPGQDRPALQSIGRARSDGSFRIGLAHGGQIGAVHARLSPSAMVLVQLEADPKLAPKVVPVRLVLMTLQAGAGGVVVDRAGQGIPGARLEFRAAEPRRGQLAAPPQQVGTDADGRFEVRHLLPGAGTWAVRAAGYGGRRATFTVAAGERLDLRLVLDAAAELHGRVEDGAGAGLPGARVQVEGPDRFELDAATTAADGTFQLGGLPAGPADFVAIEGRGSNGATARRATTHIELRAGAVSEWTAMLGDTPSGARLVGVVVDQRGQALGGWLVTLLQDGSSPRAARTGEDGDFQLDCSRGRTAQLLVHAPGLAPTAFPDLYLPAVAPDAAPLRVVVDRSAVKAVVRGQVQSSDQQPLAATVSIWHHEMRRYARCEADRDGRFQIDRIPGGSIDLYIDHPGYAGFAQQSVPVQPGAETDLGVLVLGAAAALHGTVTGPDGRPPEQLEIYILTGHQRLVAEYAGGTYRLGSIPPGRHVLQVQGRGVAGASFPIELSAATERTQDIQLLAGVARRIEVMAPAAAGNFVSLAVRVPGQAHQWLSGQARVEGAPSEFLAYMAPGSYEVLAWGAGGWQAQASIEFATGTEAPVRLELKLP